MKPSERSNLIDPRSPVMCMRNDTPARPKTVSRLFALLNGSSKNEQFLQVFSVICLVVATATERVTFKMAVDRMVPYRFVLTQLIFMTSVVLYGAIWHIKQGFSVQIPVCMKDFPQMKLMTMAALDTVQFAGLTLSASSVPPVMTVILLHASTPFLVFGSKYFFPDRKYSPVQIRGAELIALSIAVSLMGSFFSFFYPGSHQLSDPTSCMFYFAMSALHGVSMLYKEKCIVEWSKPVNIHYLSTRIFLYQIAVAFALSPFIYLLQGISSEWDGFPLTSFFSNIGDGIYCILGVDPDGNTSYDSALSDCSYSYLLVIGYVLSNIVVLESIDRILLARSRVLERALAGAVLVAFVSLAIYDNNYGIDGCLIDMANIIAVIILLIGMEIHSRDPEPDSETVTAFITA